MFLQQRNPNYEFLGFDDVYRPKLEDDKADSRFTNNRQFEP